MKVILFGLLLLVIVPVGCVSCWLIGGVSKVVDEQLNPKVLLQKYEWFKDVSAKLDSKLASLKVAEVRLKVLDKQYEGVARKDWTRTDAEQYSIWMQEINGMKASYNDLASQYNSQMAKENYRFCNIGELPKGAIVPLPREFKPYVSE